jgi:copper chaperone CopZ
MKHAKSAFLVAIVLLGANIGWTADRNAAAPEASQEVRIKAAKEKLKAQPSAVSLYVKGLCCPSCAIGVRKKIGKLDFVDKKRFTKGVQLDTKTQLATVALKKGKSPDAAALAKAVKDSGYDPVNLYLLKDGKLKIESLPQFEKK